MKIAYLSYFTQYNNLIIIVIIIVIIISNFAICFHFICLLQRRMSANACIMYFFIEGAVTVKFKTFNLAF